MLFKYFFQLLFYSCADSVIVGSPLTLLSISVITLKFGSDGEYRGVPGGIPETQCRGSGRDPRVGRATDRAF